MRHGPTDHMPDGAVGARGFAWPLAAVFGLLLLSFAAALWWTARASDARARDAQVALVENTIRFTLDQMVQNTASSAVWGDMASNVERRGGLDLLWLDNNVASWFFAYFKHDQTYVFSPQGSAIYGAVRGERLSSGALRAIRIGDFPDAAALRDRERRLDRTITATNDTIFLPSGATVGPRTAFTSGFQMVDGRPAVVGAVQIVPDFSDEPARPGRAATLVTVKFLGAWFLTDLGYRNRLAAPRLTGRPQFTRATWSAPVSASDGRPLVWVAWRPDRPGATLLRDAAPAAGAAATGLLLLLTLLVRRLARSTRALEQAVVELRASEAHASHLAFHDTLTGLPNRALLNERLERALASLRQPNRLAVLLVDLDRFKNVNDRFGHAAGDRLISECASRLTVAAGPGATVARLGGDEFAIVAPLAQGESLDELCERAIAAARAPVDLGDLTIVASLSIGAALAPGHGLDRSELLRRADIALYRAKAAGRDRHCLFDGAMDETVAERAVLEAGLRRALADGGQLAVHFQPLFAASTHRLLGFEALLRWRHPERGAIGPDRFVPVAEECGLMVPLGEWVLEETARIAAAWPALRFAVNVSAVQFRVVDFAERAMALWTGAGAALGQLEVEVTETVLLEDDATVRATLDALRRAGVHIALDDFGTGYSSLSHLRRFEVDRIKIDRSFIRNLGGKVDSAAIVSAVLALGRATGLKVTAEGVETLEQRDSLAGMGCDELQGFLFSPAVPADRIGEFAAASTPRAA